MSTLTLTATPELYNAPPRVRLDVLDSGSPAISSVNITRTDSMGHTAPVRTFDGSSLPLLASGTGRAGTVYDYEMPYGLDVSYSTSEQPAVSSNTTVVTSDIPWLVHIGVPARSQPIMVVSLSERTRKAAQGVFYPLGRANPVVVTDGRRKSAGGTLTVRTLTDSGRIGFDALIDDTAVLMLNLPATLSWGVDSCYIAVADVTERRVVRWGPHQMREWDLPYQVVGMPIGGAQSQYTWADVLVRYSSWQALMAVNPTWSSVLAPTT